MVKEDADGNNQARPHTWCDKVPKEICAPDYCQMIPGAYEAISEICKINKNYYFFREPGLPGGDNPINSSCPKGDVRPSAYLRLSHGDKHGPFSSISAELCRCSQRVLSHEDGRAKER